ncbi:2-octaprenyl-6-methoxyphenyl hydroxylase [Vibrio sp. SM6]|uniref:2-octaprenyl-6-methoxyphenyl hydroxylase n=1 Tax=Vibrio agarilyticus TaxID=2726741 RepID=A0A7X8TQF6_9VIBR|nr:2-octaprenyl-6-methoxyphenyl hydroxylase [Vibrio agarilyticus]NLS12855.1 2-octaprenyl-6-methoxyphenyl hydroxylase [Vibrio agarilyticus]
MMRFDVLVVGGGMTGACLALGLAHLTQGAMSIALVESHVAQPNTHPGFDSRSIALAHGTAQTLASLGVWASLSALAEPLRRIHVSDQHHAGMTEIDAKEQGLSALGYVVELEPVGAQLHAMLERESSITLFCPNTVKQLTQQASSVQVLLDDGVEIETRLLVAADGADSFCAQQLGLSLTTHSFEQTAVIANIGLSQPHCGQAFERFTAAGPLALLPMSDQRMSLVWCLSTERAQTLLNSSDVDFQNALQAEFGWRLGRLASVGTRASYPLALRYRERIITHRAVVVGNAAQALHPIAGQGFNLALRDVADLVEIIVANWQQGADVGEYRMLSRYRQRREPDRTAIMTLTASMVHLFSNDWLPLRLGRNLGLAMMDNVSAFKAPLLRRTLGVQR